MELNGRYRPGQIAMFMPCAAHLDDSRLMTFAASDSHRSIEAMRRDLLPAKDGERGAYEAARRH